MSNNRDQIGSPGAPLVSTIGQAAAAIATAVTEYLGRSLEASGERALAEFARNANPGSQPGSATDPIAQTFIQYRDALGDLAVALPQLAQRASLAWQAEPGMRLLFRARPGGIDGREEAEKKLHDAIEALPIGAAITADVAEKVRSRYPGDLSGALDAIQTQLLDPRRRDLQTLIGQLQQAIRANRDEGLQLAHTKLGWLFPPDGQGTSGLSGGYALLDALEDAVGGDCLREVLRERARFEAFQATLVAAAATAAAATAAAAAAARARAPAEAVAPAWKQSLTDCFRAFGFDLGAAVTVLPLSSAPRKEYVLLDHAHDRVFHIRQGVDASLAASGSKREFEVYGLREGITYFDKSQTQRPTNVPRLLPHRVQDASSGMAVWGVDRRDVQDLLNARQPAGDVKLFAWDMGASRTPLALFAVDYRQSDLGPYLELGIGCFVHPARDPLAVGMLVLENLPVSTDISSQVGNDIWGYPKEVNKKMEVRYWLDRVEWSVVLAGGSKIEVTLPRGGTRSSARVPLLSYTRKFGRLHRTVLLRSGSGESLKVGGGGVKVNVTPPNWNTTKASAGGLLGLLDLFSLVADGSGRRVRAPLYSAWTEHMSGELGAPSLVPLPPEVDER